MNITECLEKIQSLTATNVSLLKSINDAFYANKSYIATTFTNDDEGTTYNIPSFMYLESRLASLENAFQAIVDAPRTGEAIINVVDGTTQRIELSGYGVAPQRLELPMTSVDTFAFETNNALRDIANPNLYIAFDLSSYGDDLTHVAVKKVLIKSTSLRDALRDMKTITYDDFLRVSYNYTEGIDFDDYDVVKTMPTRVNNEYGEFIIDEIVDATTDANLIQRLTLRVNTLTYHVAQSTIERNIVVNDTLLTSDEKSTLVVESINTGTNTIVVRVASGWANATTGDKLLFYKSQDFTPYKQLHVTLEEDDTLIVFIARVNATTNTRSPWSDGLIVRTNELTIEIDGELIPYTTYYNKYVTNIGDRLTGIMTMLPKTLSNIDNETYTNAKNVVPQLSTDDYEVIQTNAHLNDNTQIDAIIDLYNQKTSLRQQLDVIEQKIATINTQLSTIDFTDATNNRDIYISQLNDLRASKTSLTASLNDTIRQITTAVEGTTVPIEDATFAIRGIVDIASFESSLTRIVKINVMYRRKNVLRSFGTAHSFSDNDIFSDWTFATTPYRRRVATFNATTKLYEYTWVEDTSRVNEPSFNAIDIPITQGEIVDVRVQYVYENGYPFIEFTSQWSDVVEVAFPTALEQNVALTKIIEENNNDAISASFTSTLIRDGVTAHVDDRLDDQDVVYFHQPEHIASGFFTSERRIVPLKDKLASLNADVMSLRAEVFGDLDDDVRVTISDGETTMFVEPYSTMNEFVTNDYTTTSKDATYVIDSNAGAPLQVYQNMNLTITNTGEHTIKLYSLFPGDANALVDSLRRAKFDVNDYTEVPMMLVDDHAEVGARITPKTDAQTLIIHDTKQAITFTSSGESGFEDDLTLSCDFENMLGVVDKTIHSKDGTQLFAWDKTSSNHDKYVVYEFKKTSSDSSSLTPSTSLGTGIIGIEGAGKFYFYAGAQVYVSAMYECDTKNGTYTQHTEEEGVFKAGVVTFTKKTPFNWAQTTKTSGMPHAIGLPENTSTGTSIERGTTIDLEDVSLTIDDTNVSYTYQHQSQVVTFRNNNAYDATTYYSPYNAIESNNVLMSAPVKCTQSDNFVGLNRLYDDASSATKTKGATLAINPTSLSQITTPTGSPASFVELAPNAGITIPLLWVFYLDASVTSSIAKTISFDIRTSLYRDPLNYVLKIKSNYTNDAAVKTKRASDNVKLTPVVIKG